MFRMGHRIFSNCAKLSSALVLRIKNDHSHRSTRGALHSLEKAYEIFSEQKDLYGFLMDFSGKQKDFCQRCTRVFGVKCPSG